MAKHLYRNGHPKLGGRVKGTPNRKDAKKELEEKLAMERLLAARLASQEEIKLAYMNMATMSPLEVLCMGMHLRLHRGDLEGAAQLASAAVPFTSPKLTASDVRVHQSAQRPDSEVAVEIEALRAKVERAQLSQITIEATAEPAESVRSDQGINNPPEFTEQQNQQLSDAEIG
jgi:hypothetical protein